MVLFGAAVQYDAQYQGECWTSAANLFRCEEGEDMTSKSRMIQCWKDSVYRKDFDSVVVLSKTGG